MGEKRVKFVRFALAEWRSDRRDAEENLFKRTKKRKVERERENRDGRGLELFAMLMAPSA